MDDELRKAFEIMAQDQEDARQFHACLRTEILEHPERSINENFDSVEKRMREIRIGRREP